jgi:hypothetical protein
VKEEEKNKYTMIKIKTKKKVRQCHKQVEVSEKKRTIRENK